MTEDAIRQIFCSNLNRLIREKNVTQTEIANFVGVSYPTMHHWIKGNKVPRMDKIDKLCAYFHCKRSDLLEKPSTSPPQEEFTEADKDLIRAYHKAPDYIQQAITLQLSPYISHPNVRQDHNERVS